MRIPTRNQQRGLHFNITPLIDIVFLLIIFFLVSSHFVKNEASEPVDLPVATHEQDEGEETPRRLIVTITADGLLHVAGRVVDAEMVEAMIREGAADQRGGFEVRIRADRSIPYREIEPLLMASARAGVSNVKFAVLLK